MDLRILELIAPVETVREARKFIEDEKIIGAWIDEGDEQQSFLRVLLNVEHTEKVSDDLSDRFSDAEGFRIMLFAVEATVPQPEEDKSEEEEEHVPNRISRDELYADVNEGSTFDWVYITMVILSSVVAAVGLISDYVTAIIGAMVIAPLMGPNVAMALAVTLADEKLGWRSAKANLGGLFIVFAVSFVLGMFVSIDPEGRQIISHTTVTFGDLAISMAAGAAGVLAFTVGVPATIIGVAVALALLPALVSLGLLMGAGYIELAIGSLILTVTNIISINLAGVVTFLVQGVRPRDWWDEKDAKKATRIAIAIWVVLLIVLAVSIWYWGEVDVQSMGT